MCIINNFLICYLYLKSFPIFVYTQKSLKIHLLSITKKTEKDQKRALNMDVGDIKTLLNVKTKGWVSMQNKILKS